jgi:hypothetical protein
MKKERENMVSERMRMGITDTDRPESMARKIDSGVKDKTGMSLFHMLALLSIVASIALFFSGRKMEAIFVGLWPPTFEALKSAAEK